MDQSGPTTLMQGPYVPLSTSTPVHAPSDNNQYEEATEDKSSFWQVIPSILQQSLYPSLAAMGSSLNTALSPSLARRVINEIEEHQRTVLDSYTEGMDREMNTSPVLSLDEQQVETKTAGTSIYQGFSGRGSSTRARSTRLRDTGRPDIQNITR